MKTVMIIAIETNGNRTTTEVEVPARKWDATMKQVGQQFRGKDIRTAIVIDGVDVYNYDRHEVAEIFGLED